MVDYEYENSDIDNLITQIGELGISDNFINLKTEIKHNLNITDIPSTSDTGSLPGVRTGFDKPARGYAGIQATMKTNLEHTPLGSMKNEPINPFGIYLDLDCILCLF